MKIYSAIFPFSIEKAKRITEGKDEGKIVTRNGLGVRILCFDALGDYNIVALIKMSPKKEDVETFKDDGSCFEDESEYDLLIELPIPAKINMGGLKPFDKVLVRDYYGSMWRANFFSHMTGDKSLPFSCGGFEWRYCIPYEGNEHLLGTTNDPE